MSFPKLLRKNLIVALLLLCNHAIIAQIAIHGTVYDSSQLYPLQSVSVMGTSGVGTVTDSLGHYNIKLRSGDSIYFSYLGKPTSKFPVTDIPSDLPFDMSLQVSIESLPSVLVKSRDYHFDSLENRKEYKKVFDYGPDYMQNAKMSRKGAIGLGLNMDLLLDGKSNRRMEAFQQRLEKEERDNYVDHRFTKGIVKKITGLQPPALDTFMRIYRPSYDFVQSFKTDYEFYKYIFGCGQSFSEAWKKNHPD